MDENLNRIARENDLSPDEAGELESFAQSEGLEADEAFERWKDL